MPAKRGLRPLARLVRLTDQPNGECILVEGIDCTIQPVKPHQHIFHASAGCKRLADVGKAGRSCRTCLAVRHGFDVPVYPGRRSTFALGKFGGHVGRIRGRSFRYSRQSANIAG